MSAEKNTKEELKIIEDSKNKRVHVSMIFTHQARMRCFVRKSIEPIVGTEKRKEVNDGETTTREQILSRDADLVASDFSDDETTTREQILSRHADLVASDFSDDEDYDVFNPSRRTLLSRPYDMPDPSEYAAVPDNEGAVLGGSDKWKMPRFKNGSVLRCIITHDKIKLDLLVEGEIDENKPKYVYYVNHENVSSDAGALEGKYKVTAFDPMELRNTTYPIGKDDTYVFYIVRHGQATHNTLKGVTQKMGSVLSGKKDTELTPEGTHQASRSGAEFAKLFVAMDESGKKDYPAGNIALAPRYIFTSDLRRTQQTAENFLYSLTRHISNDGMAKIITDNTQNHKWIVLPCAHELAFVDSGYCDGFQKPLPTPPENQMTCDVNDNYCGIVNKKFTIDWDDYSKFYGSSTRSKICRGCGARHCRDTDMIQEAINVIQRHVVKQAREKQAREKDVQETGYSTWGLDEDGNRVRVNRKPITLEDVLGEEGAKKIRKMEEEGKWTTGGKTKRRRKNKKHKTRKSHTRKRLTRGKRKNAHKKVKKTKKSKK